MYYIVGNFGLYISPRAAACASSVGTLACSCCKFMPGPPPSPPRPPPPQQQLGHLNVLNFASHIAGAVCLDWGTQALLAMGLPALTFLLRPFLPGLTLNTELQLARHKQMLNAVVGHSRSHGSRFAPSSQAQVRFGCRGRVRQAGPRTMASSQQGERISDNSKFDVLKNVQVAACLFIRVEAFETHGCISMDCAAEAARMLLLMLSRQLMPSHQCNLCVRHGTCPSRRRYQSSASGVTSLSRQRLCWLLHDRW